MKYGGKYAELYELQSSYYNGEEVPSSIIAPFSIIIILSQKRVDASLCEINTLDFPFEKSA